MVRDAFARAQARPRRKLTLVHKNNVLVHAGHLWSRTVDAVAAEFPDVTVDYLHVDAATIFLATDPARFDVIVTRTTCSATSSPTLAAAVTGGIGLAASGNVNPTAPPRACSSRSTARRPTSPASPRPTRPPRSSRPACCSTTSATRRGGAHHRRRRGRHRRARRSAAIHAGGGGGHRVARGRGGIGRLTTLPPLRKDYRVRHDHPCVHPPIETNANARSDAERSEILADPGFGNHFTDHMFLTEWTPDRDWHDPRVVPYGPLSLDPATAVLHYAQEIFEGLKAYAHADGSCGCSVPRPTRPGCSARAHRLALPELPVEWFIGSVRSLIETDRAWVPTGEERSLYLRPFMFASEVPGRPAQPARHVLGDRVARPRLLLRGHQAGRHLALQRVQPGGRRWHGRREVRRQLRRQPAAPAGGRDARLRAGRLPGLGGAPLGRGARRHEPVHRARRRIDRHARAQCSILEGNHPRLDPGHRQDLATTSSSARSRSTTGATASPTARSPRSSPAAPPRWSLRWASSSGTVARVVSAEGEPGKVTADIRSALVDIQYGRAEDRHGWDDPRGLTSAEHEMCSLSTFQPGSNVERGAHLVAGS